MWMLMLHVSSPFSSRSPQLQRSLTHTFIMYLTVLITFSFLIGAFNKANAQMPINNDHGHHDDNLNRNSEVRDSEIKAMQQFGTNSRDQSNSNKQAQVQPGVQVYPEKTRDSPFHQSAEKLQVKEEKEIQRKTENEEKRRQLIMKQKMEERDRLLLEQIQQQDRRQQQARNQQNNILEAQKEQQREQQWLKEVQRKSYQVLAERNNKQQQLSQNNTVYNQAHGARGSSREIVNDAHSNPKLQSIIPSNTPAPIKPGSNPDHHNSINENNSIIKAEITNKETILINDPLHEPQKHKGIASAGEAGNVQNQNKDINRVPDLVRSQEDINIHSIREYRRKDEATSSGASSASNLNKEVNASVTHSEARVVIQSQINNNPSVGKVDLVERNPSEVNGNAGNSNNQFARAEVNNNNNFINNNNNNAQQQQQQQQHQQPQIGGINLSWDWEDFSVMFNSYGAAEMKVRRSPHPTTGEPWPLPQYYSKNKDKIYKISKEMHFVPTGIKCDILEEAMTRHLQRTLRGCVEDMYDNLQNAEGSPIEDPSLRYEKDEFQKAPVITRVEVKVRKSCDKYPSLESDESYDLVVKKRKTYIWANEIWGALRGLETFGHLVWRGTDGFIYMKETVISDYPRFPHRGLHIDTSRHFLFKEVILDILDSMEMNKLNVFHWHIVDDQSFPYESKVYPELSRKGAFHPTYVYTLEDIAEIIEYARLRGIRVMPEFDTPGHTFAWGLSRPELLTQCYSGSIPVKGYLGPIDPSKNSTYRFLQALFKEIVEVFKDQYLHLGGDEVPLGCWQSNPEVAAFAQELARKPRDPLRNQGNNAQNNANINQGWSMWSDDIRRVYEYYENRLINIVNEIGQKRKKGIKYVMWQEVMNNNLQLPNDTIIQVWMGDMADVMRATSLGYKVIYSTCWYMDHIEYGTKWPKYYNCDPADQSFGYHIDEKKVLGGEAAFWAEYFSNENLIPLMWPRASAAAERLWSSKEVKNLDKAAERLAEHRCRMIKRGINAGEINGPGYCLHPAPRRRLFNDTAGCKGGNCSRIHNFVQIEDFEVHVSHRGGSLADCGNVFTPGNNNVFILLTLALIVVVALYAWSKSSSHFHRIRICKNRSILIVFVGVLLVYLLCYTTIWMRAFEFSGSFHKTLQEDNRAGFEGGAEHEDSNFKPITS